jgi:hypothetical protein
MKPEDEQMLHTFCVGKVITRIDFPTPDKLQLVFANDTGIEISEPRAGAKGLVVRLIRPTVPPATR